MSKTNSRAKENYKKVSKEMEIILDNIPGLIFFKDTMNRFIRVNKKVADAYNLSKEDMKGKSLFELHSNEQAQAYWEDDLEVVRVGEPKLNIEESWDTDKGICWFSTNKIPYKDDNGKIQGIIGFSVDITERKKGEEKLRLHSEIMANLAEGVYLIRLDDNIIVFANPRFEEMFGYSPGEMIGKNVTIVNAPTDKTPEETKQDIMGILREKGEWHGEVKNIKKDGTHFWCYANVSVFDHPEYGAVIVSVHTDITERKIAEEQLKKSLETTEKIMDALPIGILLIGADKRVRSVNKVALNLLKIENENDLIGKICNDHFCPSEGDCCHILDLKQTIDNSERILRNSENIEIPILKSAILLHLNGEKLILEAFTDIMEQKLTQEKLKESETNLIALNEELELKVKERTNALNERVKELTCIYELSNLFENPNNTVEDIIRGTLKLIPPAWQFPTITCARIIFHKKKFTEDTFRESKWKLSIITEINKKDLKIEVFYLEDKPFLKEERYLLSDIRNRLKNFIEQKETEQKFRFLFEKSPDPIFLMDLNGNLKDCNPEGEKKFGYTREEIIGNPFMKFSWFVPETIPLVVKTFKTLASGEIPEPLELQQRRKDGSLLWVNVLFSFMTVGEEKLVQVITQDISKIKDTEKKLIDTMEKLKRSNAELEQFAHIVSHDLQEPLRMVSSFTQLLQKRYHDKLDNDANDFINFAVDGTERMQRLINDLLVYSRVGTQSNSLKAIDMNIILKSVLGNSHQLIEENNASINLDPLPVIIADESQMIQLFQNLLSNAIKFNENKSPLVQVSAEVLKTEWRFSVQDNGIGIEPKDLERLFIIFQRLHKTEKYPGRGLGLAICKKIVQRHGGRIWVESEPSKGAKFYISIPREQLSDNISY